MAARVEVTYGPDGAGTATYEEANWHVDDHGQLHIMRSETNGPTSRRVAIGTYARGAWSSVRNVPEDES